MTTTAIDWIAPDWPAPTHVRVLSTLRAGGVSVGPYASLNLAAHVGDRPEAVSANRLLLREAAHLPAEPLWLEQVHGINVIRHPGDSVAVRQLDVDLEHALHRLAPVAVARVDGHGPAALRAEGGGRQLVGRRGHDAFE